MHFSISYVRRFTQYLILSLCLVAPQLIAAQHNNTVSSQDQILTYRPDPAGTPTKVRVSLYVNDIPVVEDVNHAFESDFLLKMQWKDISLSHEGVQPVIMNLKDIWSPRIMIFNQRNVERYFADIVQVTPDGTVHYGQRYHGRLTRTANLEKFPRENAELLFRLVAFGYDRTEIELIVEESTTGRATRFANTEWDMGELSYSIGEEEFVPGGKSFTSITFSMKIQRLWKYYFWKTVVPLTLIVWMSWAVFWIHPDNIEPQTSISSISILTLITYQFYLNDVLPKVSYLTRMDIFVLCCSLLVFLAFTEAIVTATLAQKQKRELAARTDKVSRLIFPLAFIAISIFSFW
jgi:hypothetical protein